MAKYNFIPYLVQSNNDLVRSRTNLSREDGVNLAFILSLLFAQLLNLRLCEFGTSCNNVNVNIRIQ
jgi:hypothetical protein